MTHHGTLAFAVAGVLLAGATAPIPAYARGDAWTTDPYDTKVMSINVKRIGLKKGKIWFELAIVNKSDDKVLVLDPDRIQAKTPDGRTVSRLKGVFDKWSAKHQAMAIKPNGGEDLSVEYTVGEPRKVALVFNGATLGDKPIKLPDLVARPADLPWVAGEYRHNGVRVTVEDGSLDGESLALKLNILNETAAPLFVDANGFTARLATGETVERVKGMLDKLKKPALIPAHATGSVSLEFKIGQSPSIALQMGGINSGALNLPEMKLAPKD